MRYALSTLPFCNMRASSAFIAPQWKPKVLNFQENFLFTRRHLASKSRGILFVDFVPTTNPGDRLKMGRQCKLFHFADPT